MFLNEKQIICSPNPSHQIRLQRGKVKRSLIGAAKTRCHPLPSKNGLSRLPSGHRTVEGISRKKMTWMNGGRRFRPGRGSDRFASVDSFLTWTLDAMNVLESLTAAGQMLSSYFAKLDCVGPIFIRTWSVGRTRGRSRLVAMSNLSSLLSSLPRVETLARPIHRIPVAVSYSLLWKIDIPFQGASP